MDPLTILYWTVMIGICVVIWVALVTLVVAVARTIVNYNVKNDKRNTKDGEIE